MNTPDPNGCARCGRLECRVPVLRAIRMRKRSFEQWEALRAALDECGMHPAVDWQAECRRLAPPSYDPPNGKVTLLCGCSTAWVRCQEHAAQQSNDTPADEPLAEATTIVHPDDGDGPYILPPRMTVPRATAGERLRLQARRG